VLGDLPVSHHDEVLIDYRTSDDAGVYRLDGDRALVQTVDFFTPIVDDPFAYGQIAAANSLSDVYAMGGRPLTALAIAGFPKDADRGVLKAIFAGGLNKLDEAGVALLGGHTVQDHEIKFGYSVTGEVDPRRVWSNAGARVGDVLFLTKPLGTGIIATALKFDRAPSPAVDAAVASMLTLNRAATDALRQLTVDAVHGCTDITGFGLIGHASEMAAASGVTVEIDASAVPLLEGVLALVESHPGNIPGGGRSNAEYFSRGVKTAPDLPPALVKVLFDPQTSGGLLVAVASDRAAEAAEAMSAAGVPAAHIGRVVQRANYAIFVK
jgi:selenide, water dikinase